MVKVYVASPSDMMTKKKKLPKKDIAGVVCFKCYKVIEEGDIMWSLEKHAHYDCNYPHGK